MDHLFDSLSYEVDKQMYVHDDFGNLIPMSWSIAFALIFFLMADTDSLI